MSLRSPALLSLPCHQVSGWLLKVTAEPLLPCEHLNWHHLVSARYRAVLGHTFSLARPLLLAGLQPSFPVLPTQFYHKATASRSSRMARQALLPSQKPPTSLDLARSPLSKQSQKATSLTAASHSLLEAQHPQSRASCTQLCPLDLELWSTAQMSLLNTSSRASLALEVAIRHT